MMVVIKCVMGFIVLLLFRKERKKYVNEECVIHDVLGRVCIR